MVKRISHEESLKPDPMSKADRSAQMARVRGEGNRSTEGTVETALVEAGIQGWEKHPKDILGKPDFFFPAQRLALFVDGCFWHACPVCKRRIPKSDFWKNKIENNRRRDNRVHSTLRREGYHVMRVWEHDLKKDTWLKRLNTIIQRIEVEKQEKGG